jgi:hypothetical protein
MHPIDSIRTQLKEHFKDFDPDVCTADDAAEFVVWFAEIERIGAAGKLMAARRVEKTGLHEREGHKAAGSWLAGLTGESVGQAASRLETAKRVEAHPAVSDAFKSGAISESQAKEIASACDRSPGLASELVAEAPWLDFGQLKKRCGEIRSAATSAEDEITRHERVRKARFCRTWVDSDGVGHLQAQMTTDCLGILRAVLGGYEKQIFEDARKAGLRETQQAYMADALVAMAQGSVSPGAGAARSAGRKTSSCPIALVRVRVDATALARGHVVAGETCSIPGLGPVPVAMARELMGDAILELVVTRGTDVTTVCTDSRYVRKALRIALEERDQVCVVPGCNISDPLERDHWQVDYAKKGPTELDNLARLCPYHHHQRTHGGWELEGPPGQWKFVKVAEPPPPGTSPPDSEPPGQVEVGGRRARHLAERGADPPVQPGF